MKFFVSWNSARMCSLCGIGFVDTSGKKTVQYSNLPTDVWYLTYTVFVLLDGHYGNLQMDSPSYSLCTILCVIFLVIKLFFYVYNAL